ncbi:MAG: cation transporter [Lachnospiraceae bacterium]|nr:cation transporter [Lachnospiraceae bacterium]
MTENNKNNNSDIRETNIKKVAFRLTVVTVAWNLILFVFKLAAGIAADSGAMISDAVHSLSDIFTTIVAVVGVYISQKEADDEHQYGHERLECVAGLILAAVLMIVGLGIGYSGIGRIIGVTGEAHKIPGIMALVAAVVSIVIKEAMFWYTRHYAKMIDSSAFMADAWHHRSDAISSVGALIGIGFARMGYPVMDSVASVLICIFVLKTSFDIMAEAIGKMTDKACDEETQRRLSEYIASYGQVRGIDLLKTRMFGNRIYVEVEICLDGDMPLRSAHDIAEEIHDGLEQEFRNVKHIMIHINPA